MAPHQLLKLSTFAALLACLAGCVSSPDLSAERRIVSGLQCRKTTVVLPDDAGMQATVCINIESNPQDDLLLLEGIADERLRELVAQEIRLARAQIGTRSAQAARFPGTP